MIIYFIGMYVISLMLSYELSFIRAIFEMGKSISDPESKRVFQDAITPPWSTNLGLITYIMSLGGIGFGWYKYGWIIGLSSTVGFLFIVFINKNVVMPKSYSEYFRRLIIQSVIKRYVNYKKSGDEMRASAAKILLEKLDIPVPEIEDRMRSESKERNDN